MVKFWISGLQKRWEPFSQLMWFKIGDGSEFRSWYGSWCCDVVLKYSPDVFLRAVHKECSVASRFRISRGACHWNIRFVRPLQDWELELDDLLLVYYTLLLHC
jgi:hypothetical protein